MEKYVPEWENYLRSHYSILIHSGFGDIFMYVSDNLFTRIVRLCFLINSDLFFISNVNVSENKILLVVNWISYARVISVWYIYDGNSTSDRRHRTWARRGGTVWRRACVAIVKVEGHSRSRYLMTPRTTVGG